MQMSPMIMKGGSRTKHSPMLGQLASSQTVTSLFPQDVPDFVEARGRATGLDANPVGFLGDLALLHLTGMGLFGMRLLFEGGVVFGGTLSFADGVLGGVPWAVSGRVGGELSAQDVGKRPARAPTRRL